MAKFVNHWKSTLAFRNFRDKTSDLSRIYWMQQLGTDGLKELLSAKNPNDVTSKVISASFNSHMHTHTVAETLAWSNNFMEKNRLHLLVIFTAFLETYLKEITFYYLASKGHIKNENESVESIKLSSIGEALGAPILRRSTVPDMIKYSSELFGVDFASNAAEWDKIYKVRCVAAHLGGIATPKFLKSISNQPLALQPAEYDSIGLTWEELRSAMKSGDEIATMIDSTVSSASVRFFECEEIIRALKAKKKLPKKDKLWQLLHDKYQIGLSKNEKEKLAKKFYGTFYYR